MTEEAKQLEAAVLSLPQKERAKLANRLIASLDEEIELDEEWRAEVKERLEAYRDETIESSAARNTLAEAKARTEES